MALTFYYLSGSPFSWKVWLALEHKELPYELRALSADAGDLETPDFLSLNPRGKVPVVVDDGFVLSESAAIVAYLEDRCRGVGAPLWPADARARARARRVAIEGDSLIYPHARKLVVELVMRKDGAPDQALISEGKTALERELAALDSSASRMQAGHPARLTGFARRLASVDSRCHIRSPVSSRSPLGHQRVEPIHLHCGEQPQQVGGVNHGRGSCRDAVAWTLDRGGRIGDQNALATRTRNSRDSAASRSLIVAAETPADFIACFHGLRDRALFGTMAYTFARVSAVSALRVEHLYRQKQRLWLRHHECRLRCLSIVMGSRTACPRRFRRDP